MYVVGLTLFDIQECVRLAVEINCLTWDLQEGWTPLHIAVQCGRTDIINLLVARGADTTVKNKAMCIDNILSSL